MKRPPIIKCAHCGREAGRHQALTGLCFPFKSGKKFTPKMDVAWAGV